ncbi:hypothetical protein SDC9_147855 [bioreactor metagenome]|uniref:Uncharacterized protein n=1 Tax=bioreactor metagenome TaxID=1076179 RepID=A0A645EHN2_9ZZZZ
MGVERGRSGVVERHAADDADLAAVAVGDFGHRFQRFARWIDAEHAEVGLAAGGDGGARRRRIGDEGVGGVSGAHPLTGHGVHLEALMAGSLEILLHQHALGQTHAVADEQKDIFDRLRAGFFRGGGEDCAA